MAGGDSLPDKSRDGATARKRYEKPATPCDRLLSRDDVGEETQQRPRVNQVGLDPISLLHTIREAQTAFASIRDSAPVSASNSEGMERFFGRLPDLWRQGDVRATHDADAQKGEEASYLGAPPDPFEGVWCEMLDWLQRKPDAMSKELLDQLIRRYPERFSTSHRRTLQRRVRHWQRVMAQELVSLSAEQSEMNEADLSSITHVSDN